MFTVYFTNFPMMELWRFSEIQNLIFFFFWFRWFLRQIQHGSILPPLSSIEQKEIEKLMQFNISCKSVKPVDERIFGDAFYKRWFSIFCFNISTEKYIFHYHHIYLFFKYLFNLLLFLFLLCKCLLCVKALFEWYWFISKIYIHDL